MARCFGPGGGRAAVMRSAPRTKGRGGQAAAGLSRRSARQHLQTGGHDCAPGCPIRWARGSRPARRVGRARSRPPVDRNRVARRREDRQRGRLDCAHNGAGDEQVPWPTILTCRALATGSAAGGSRGPLSVMSLAGGQGHVSGQIGRAGLTCQPGGSPARAFQPRSSSTLRKIGPGSRLALGAATELKRAVKLGVGTS